MVNNYIGWQKACLKSVESNDLCGGFVRKRKRNYCSVYNSMVRHETDVQANPSLKHPYAVNIIRYIHSTEKICDAMKKLLLYPDGNFTH